jgi:glycosyltransferase involved in cell wall biosynthesis
LPSLKEEWGLVVNEAMAAGLPVIVSRTAGCAEDLLPEATASRSSQLAVDSRQQEADARAGRSMEHGAGGSIQFGEDKTNNGCKPLTDDSLEERSNGFAFDPTSSDALSEALRRIADPLNVAYGPSPAIRPTVQRSTVSAAAMGRRSREIVAKFSCENFAKQALRAAEAASA